MKISWFDAPVYIVSTIPEREHQILGYARIRDNQWNEHPNFVREWRGYRKGKRSTKNASIVFRCKTKCVIVR